MTRHLTLAVFLIAMLTTMSGCVGRPPREEYTLANTAILAAKAAQAPRFAPGFFTKAEQFYRQAQHEFEDREYSQAHDDFEKARKLAEQAENYTILKKAETGEAN